MYEQLFDSTALYSVLSFMVITIFLMIYKMIPTKINQPIK